METPVPQHWGFVMCADGLRGGVLHKETLPKKHKNRHKHALLYMGKRV